MKDAETELQKEQKEEKIEILVKKYTKHFINNCSEKKRYLCKLSSKVFYDFYYFFDNFVFIINTGTKKDLFATNLNKL